MKYVHTTKTEQVLLSIVLFSCSVLVVGAVLVLLTPHAPSLQLAHAAAATHLPGVAATAG